jgi:endonuclease/exonuclease/phosphatase family metal-dependent hydrolase
VVRACAPDLVVFQEARFPHAVRRIADACGMKVSAARVGHSLAFMSAAPVAEHAWHKPRLSRHAFLEIVPAGDRCRVFGLHLSAVHAAWTERRRLFELRALLLSIARHQQGLHLLVGDFNTLAPGEYLDMGKLPARLRALVWLSGGTVRWRTIHSILEAGYVDGFRQQHPDQPGSTFPTWSPHLRLDFAFLPAAFTDRLRSCEVVTLPDAADASDHFPLLTEIAD